MQRRFLRRVLALAVGATAAHAAGAQRPSQFTHADTLRGTNTPERAWWDVTFYDLHVRVSPGDSTIAGYNAITYRVTGAQREMQIDLQVPMQLDSIIQDGKTVTSRRDGNAFFVTLASPQPTGRLKTVTVYYHGRPRAARNPPWDGGFIWRRDSTGHTWVSTADQGLGASVWWPNKDAQWEEPDSQRVAITVPDTMLDVSNGRLRSTKHNPDGTTTFEWFATSPINNYAISVNAGAYSHYTENYAGVKGNLTLDFWPLTENLAKAKSQFTQARAMIACFENWFGPFPWYEDGYKLLEAPHLGMEHQSAVAYGNHYANGYLGRDLSGSGEGLKWDFIIVHESAHEWWGNNITAADMADNWIHEGFANYAEGVFSECQDGKDAGSKYVIGSRRNIRNDAPIIGAYGVGKEGSGDMYYKGGSMLHTIRQVIGNDDKWKSVLHGLQSTFARKVVTTKQVEDYISTSSGIDFSKVFDQYLRTTKVPVLEYRVVGTTLFYRWNDVASGFAMPVRVGAASGPMTLIHPTDQWQSMASPLALSTDELKADDNFYVKIQRVEKEELDR